MNVVLEEARESYEPEIVIQLENNSLEDMETNAERIHAWRQQWIENQSNETDSESMEEDATDTDESSSDGLR